jgi:hypothetical protein
MRAVDEARMREAFEFQARACGGLGSALYAGLLERCCADLERGSAVRGLVEGWSGDPFAGFLPLRVLAGVHRRVLEGREPELARYYPTAGGTSRFPDVADAFLEVLSREREALRPALAHVPQTNEVNRCAGLLGGFLEVARRTGRPLRLLEIGASAGLNLRWDRYRYALGSQRFGDPGASVEIRVEWRGQALEPAAVPAVERRLGCDAAPIDPLDPEQRARLASFLWADQPERLERQGRAVEVARAVPAALEAGRAGEWLPARLAEPVRGVARVVYHSAVWAYLPAAERERVRECLAEAGRSATADAPLAWLRLEEGKLLPELQLTLWPGGDERRLARAHPHCTWVEWWG